MDTSMVSVVIPVYRAEKYLSRTIESVLHQTYDNWEMILVDDHSPDTSLKIARDYSRKDSRIRVISLEENGGVAHARNVGIEAAAGKYIALLDSDDTWEPQKLEMQVALMKRESADIVYCSFDLIDTEDRRQGKPFLVPRETDYEHMLVKCVFNCCTAMFRAPLLKQHPFPLNQTHEDYVLWMELMALPSRALGIPDILAHNRQVDTSRSHNKLHAAVERWKIYRHTFGFGYGKTMKIFAQYGFNGIRKYYS